MSLKRKSKKTRSKPRKQKAPLTAAQRRAKKRRKAETEIIFINGKQKRIQRSPTIDGIGLEEFIIQNATPTYLHQSEQWEQIEPSR